MNLYSQNRLIICKGMYGKWEASNTGRVQGYRVSAGVKGKDGRISKPLLTGDIEALVRKKKSSVGSYI